VRGFRHASPTAPAAARTSGTPGRKSLEEKRKRRNSGRAAQAGGDPSGWLAGPPPRTLLRPRGHPPWDLCSPRTPAPGRRALGGLRSPSWRWS